MCDQLVLSLQDNLIMAGTVLGVILNTVLLAQSLHTAHRDQQTEGAVLKPQMS